MSKGTDLRAKSIARKRRKGTAPPIDLATALRGEVNDDRPKVRRLLANIKRALPKLEKLLEEAEDHWVYEDGVYRFYHGSWKVFHLEGHTLAIVDALASLSPPRNAKVSRRRLRNRERQTGGPLNPWFMRIIAEGTGKTFKRADNDHWLKATRPIVEAFFHAHYFLQMVVKYGNELKVAPAMLPSGWAAVLYLYNTR